MKRAALLLALAGLSGTASHAATPPLRVLAYETAPFFFRGPDGQPAGIEHDILQYYAKSKGRTLEVTWTDDFESVLQRIARGEAHVGAATITITPERRQQVAFSAPYFPTRVMLVEPKDRSTQRLGELAGTTVAAMKGTTYEELLRAIPRVQLVHAASEAAMLELVANGRARATAADSAVALTLLPRYPSLRLGIPLSPEQGFGFAVRRGSALERELGSHIQQLKTSQIYFRILEKHLGEEAARLVAAGKS